MTKEAIELQLHPHLPSDGTVSSCGELLEECV